MGPDQRYRLRSHFCHLVPRFDAVAERFFDRLAERRPEMGRELAPRREEVRQRLLTAMGLVVTRADRLEELEGALLEMGEGSVDYACTPDEYAIVLDELVGTIGEWSGPMWSEQLERDWTDALDTVADLLVRVMRARPAVTTRAMAA